jgi:hypothetical protein
MMTQSKISAFLEEFKLNELLGGYRINDVHVARISEEYMDRTPERVKIDVFMDIYYAWKRFVLMDENYEKVLDVGVMPITKKWYSPRTWSGEIHFKETISEALVRIGKAVNVHAILVIEPIQIRYEDFYNLTILKAPKGFIAQGWLEEIHRRDRATIKEKITEIDNEISTV